MTLRDAVAWEQLAEVRGVSEVARSSRGFLSQYKAAGSEARMSPYWRRRRAGFVARHMAQLSDAREPLFDEDGLPTRRHLALIMWAYTPTPARLRAAARRWL